MGKRPLMIIIVLVFISIAAWVVWHFYPTDVQHSFQLAIDQTESIQFVKERVAETVVDDTIERQVNNKL
ncbi:hypothetical protein N780_16000 [Pontibacillus chungwhensis BH030062]|uniref:Uncharacterized protein n=1 Tax=Pontibacillus chungwhensis BH030062 TaxID=1385513 RepID=A0A0A2UVQ0_9BACI|nr:hypothetical protein [Pontibacillus chungwhensis]KGP92009.1 hypothetical protein N780_16000 [Pontibacillus chungwhensis BH030062]